MGWSRRVGSSPPDCRSSAPAQAASVLPPGKMTSPVGATPVSKTGGPCKRLGFDSSVFRFWIAMPTWVGRSLLRRWRLTARGSTPPLSVACGVTVARLPLKQRVLVRIQASQLPRGVKVARVALNHPVWVRFLAGQCLGRNVAGGATSVSKTEGAEQARGSCPTAVHSRADSSTVEHRFEAPRMEVRPLFCTFANLCRTGAFLRSRWRVRESGLKLVTAGADLRKDRLEHFADLNGSEAGSHQDDQCAKHIGHGSVGVLAQQATTIHHYQKENRHDRQ